MYKVKRILPLFFVLWSQVGFSQQLFFRTSNVDSLKTELVKANNDTTRANIFNYLCWSYRSISVDSSIFYGEKALSLSRTIKYPFGEANALIILGFNYSQALNNPGTALQLALKAYRVADKAGVISSKAWALERIGIAYRELQEYDKAFQNFNQSIGLFKSLNDSMMVVTVQQQKARTFFEMNQLDSGIYYAKLIFEKTVEYKIPWLYIDHLNLLSYAYEKQGNAAEAIQLIRDIPRTSTYFRIANIFYAQNNIDSAKIYAQKALESARTLKTKVDAAHLLSKIYEQIDIGKSLEYQRMVISNQDSLINLNKSFALKNLLSFNEQELQYELETANILYWNKIKLYATLLGLGLIIIVVTILYRNNRKIQQANSALQSTLQKLQSTQSQLIQSEKMASLGELTAGIAHEIQNPLNFVNNFSEVSNELMEEMKGELDKGDINEAKLIATDIQQNLSKITHHGKRADSIVKGMLQHSRKSNGQKELTDINAICDEYLRLSYHGLRAKDSSFTASFETLIDPSIVPIYIIPQDMGRVLLNLINNAFYAVNEKARNGIENYTPKVIVKAQKQGDRVKIMVEDNGMGIPMHSIDKIFQPFFTTKPTGQGTGLGLSLSYDIVKAHGGSLSVESEVGKGTVFTIMIPIS